MKTLAVLLFALSASGADDGFAKWWPQFQSAVAKGDAKAITEGSKFPMQWELGTVREIKTREDFVAHFAAHFTADMKRAVANRKPVAVPEGYMITWKARGNEYSLYFRPAGGAFALSGLSEGPP
jgi:hypothetical protein